MPGIQLPIGIETVNPVDADYKRGPWPTIAAAKAGIPLALRYNNLSFYVVGDPNEYYWLDTDLTNAGLLIRSSSGGSSLPIVHQVYLVEDPSDAILMGGVTSNVYTNAQAAYNAAVVLSAGGTVPVAIMVGKTTSAAVGGINITSNYTISIIGISTADSYIQFINADSAIGSAFGFGSLMCHLTIDGDLSARAAGPTGDAGSFANGSWDLVINGSIDLSVTNPLNTLGSGGTFSHTAGNPGGGITVNADIYTSAQGPTAYAGDFQVVGSTLVVNGSVVLANNNEGGNIYVVGTGAGITISGILGTPSASSAASHVLYSALISGVTLGIRGAFQLEIENSYIDTLDITTVGAGSCIVLINKSSFSTGMSFTGLCTLTVKQTIIQQVIRPPANAIFLNCTIFSMVSVATVTLNVKGTTINNPVGATITLTNYNSIIPTVRYVYLVQDNSDLLKMGDRHNNVYTTFQAAYDAANALQVTLGGANRVIIRVGNTTNTVGSVVLTTDWNTNVAISGINALVSNIGAVSLTNAAGNGSNFGSGSPILISNITMGGILTTATGLTGNAGNINLLLEYARVGNLTAYPTNPANTTGNSGTITVQTVSSATCQVANIQNSLFAAGSTGLTGGITITGLGRIRCAAIRTSLTQYPGSGGGAMTLRNVDCSLISRYSYQNVSIKDCTALVDIIINDPSITLVTPINILIENTSTAMSGVNGGIACGANSVGAKLNVFIKNVITVGIQFENVNYGEIANTQSNNPVGNAITLLTCAYVRILNSSLSSIDNYTGPITGSYGVLYIDDTPGVLDLKVLNSSLLGGTYSVESFVTVSIFSGASYYEVAADANTTITPLVLDA